MLNLIKWQGFDGNRRIFDDFIVIFIIKSRNMFGVFAKFFDNRKNFHVLVKVNFS